MIAWTGIEKFNQGISDAIENQEVISRWPLGKLIPGGIQVIKKKKESLLI